MSCVQPISSTHIPNQPPLCSPGDATAAFPMDLDVGAANASSIQCLFPGDNFVTDDWYINSENQAPGSATFEMGAPTDNALDISMLDEIASSWTGEAKALHLMPLDTLDGTKNATEIGAEPEKLDCEKLVDGPNTDAASEIPGISYAEAGEEDFEKIWAEYTNSPGTVENTDKSDGRLPSLDMTRHDIDVDTRSMEQSLGQQGEQHPNPNQQSESSRRMTVIDLTGDDADIEGDYSLPAQSTRSRQSSRRHLASLQAEGMINWAEADGRLSGQDDQDKNEFGGGTELQATDELDDAQTVVETLINDFGAPKLFLPILEPMKGAIKSFRSMMEIRADDGMRVVTSQFLEGIVGLLKAIVKLRGIVYSSSEVLKSDLPFYDDEKLWGLLNNIGKTVRTLLKDPDIEKLR